MFVARYRTISAMQGYRQFCFHLQIHKRLGDTDKALMHFSWAMDLDPKGVNTQIKESIEPSLPRAADADANIGEPEQADLDNQEQNESDASF